jgi:hypothetical protein
MSPSAEVYEITLYDEQHANGVAQLIAALLNRNLDYYRSRVGIAHRMSRPVAIINSSTGNACTIVFGRAGAVVYSDLVGRPAVIVKGTVDQILNLSQIRTKVGGLFPVGLLSTPGKRVLREVRTRRLFAKGLLLHPLTALRVIALMSAAE